MEPVARMSAAKSGNCLTTCIDCPGWRKAPSGLRAHRFEPLDRGGQPLVAGPIPPILGENLDLLDAAEASGLDHAANGAKIDHAVAHHAAVGEEVLGRHQPVADVVGDD